MTFRLLSTNIKDSPPNSYFIRESQAMKFNLKPDPDFSRLEKVLRRNGNYDKLPFYELYSDLESEVLAFLGIAVQRGKNEAEYKLNRHIQYMLNLGYDYINIGRNWKFDSSEKPSIKSYNLQRSFVTSDVTTIQNKVDFDLYSWPDIKQLDYSRFEDVSKVMPQGMKVIAQSSGILENVMLLLGFEKICLLIYDDLELVSNVFSKVADCIIEYFRIVSAFDSVGALSISDDLGFKTHTILPPTFYREHLFEYYRKLVSTVHENNKPVILHSCGNIEPVIPDLIACGWDAKHSFEDEIMPIWDFKNRFGRSISPLGGFDVHKLCTMTEEQVRDHTRKTIELCGDN